jgi:hypothetical protein
MRGRSPRDLDTIRRRSSASPPRVRVAVSCLGISFAVACALDFDRFRPPLSNETSDSAISTVGADGAADTDSSMNEADAAHKDARDDDSSDASSRELDASR